MVVGKFSKAFYRVIMNFFIVVNFVALFSGFNNISVDD